MSPPRRRGPTAASKAKAARIAAALAGLLEDPDEPSPPADGHGTPYRGSLPPPPRPRAPLELRCPGCAAPMRIAHRRGVEIHQCRECDGLWLDPGDLQSLVDPPPASATASIAAVRRHMQTAPRSPPEIRYRACPRCKSIMNRRNFGSHSGVIVDECTRHGSFLDPGEFEAIETFISHGGLTLAARNVEGGVRERRRALDRELEERDRELTELRMRRRYWWGIFGWG